MKWWNNASETSLGSFFLSHHQRHSLNDLNKLTVIWETSTSSTFSSCSHAYSLSGLHHKSITTHIEQLTTSVEQPALKPYGWLDALCLIVGIKPAVVIARPPVIHCLPIHLCVHSASGKATTDQQQRQQQREQQYVIKIKFDRPFNCFEQVPMAIQPDSLFKPTILVVNEQRTGY